MKKKDEVSARQRIVLAAITCIEREGLQSVTIRGIAEEAKANIAAVNYYFGTKEKLLDEALGLTLNEMVKMVEEELGGRERDPRKALYKFYTTFMDGAFAFPNITRAHLQKSFLYNDYSTPFVEQFSKFLEELYKKMKIFLPLEASKNLKVFIIQDFSTIVLPALFPGMFSSFSGIDFHNVKDRRRYIRQMLKRSYGK